MPAKCEYEALAAFIYQHCLRFGCSDSGELTWDCCRYPEVHKEVPACAQGRAPCPMSPSERPVACTIHFCDRIAEMGGQEFMKHYRKLLEELRAADPERIEYIAGFKSRGFKSPKSEKGE